MKKMLIIALIALFYIAISAMTPPQTVPVDKDVGYSLTIVDQNQILIPCIAIPVIGESQYSCTQEKLSLTNSDNIINENQISQSVSNVANYSLTWQRAILINTSFSDNIINENQISQSMSQGLYQTLSVCDTQATLVNTKLIDKANIANMDKIKGGLTRLDIGENILS